MQQISSNPIVFLTLIISLVAIILAIYSLVLIRQFNRLKTVFFSGSAAVNLESVIEHLSLGVQTLSDEQAHTANQLAKLYEHSTFATQKVGLIRFNPFNDGGGNFSFSLALLDGHDTGVIITSMYGREQNRIYTKKVVRGGSDAPLTEEEQQAITEANEQF